MSKSKFLSALLVSVILLVAVLGISACVDVTPEPVVHVITFDSNGGSPVETLCAGDGLTVAKPVDPTKEGYEFLGWFLGETKYDFDTPVTEDITLTAHWQAKAPVVTHTVTFNTVGGSSVPAQTVEDGKLAVKPENPTREHYSFLNWFNGSVMYDFSTPVTSDITLEADWEEKQYQVTFDTDGGNAITGKLVTYGSAIERPEKPAKEGFYFEGWFVDDVKYDFSAPVSKELTIKAHWSSVADVDNAFLSALSADYSNYTSAMTVTDAETSYTDVFKQTATLAYWQPESAIYEDHLVIFSESGSMLAMYYLHDEQWLKSNLITCADFVVALYLDEIALSDVEYSEGVYHVVSASVDGVVYALFRSTEYYNSLDIIVENGHITKVVGVLDEMVHEQTFYAFGETEIELPDTLPAPVVSIETKNRDLEEGNAIDLNELINFLFKAKVEGKDYAITSEMVDLNGLDVANPAVGEYTITLTIVTWDGIDHSETATVSVKTSQSGDETFADIFGKDYSNVTITYSNGSSTTTYKVIDNVYWMSTAALPTYYIAEADATNSLTMYKDSSNKGTFTETKDSWTYMLVRIDLLFALNVDLFEQVDDTNVYVAKNNEALIDMLLKTTMTKTYKINTVRDYSITLTVELGRVSKISVSYYALTASQSAGATTGTLRALQYTLTEFGTTDFEVPQGILELRGEASQTQEAILDGKKYVA